jgi:hypothetical protein
VTGASIYDNSPHFDYKLPFELGGGVAVVGKRAEIEFDVKGYSSIDRYALLSSDQPMAIYSDPGNGTRGTTTNIPFTSLTSAPRQVTNYMVGGHVLVLQGQKLTGTIHAGYGTDFSQVALDQTSVFDRVDFKVFTAGVSGTIGGKFSGAIGFNYRKGGQSQNLVLQNLITGPVQASLAIHTLGMTYSLNYKF